MVSTSIYPWGTCICLCSCACISSHLVNCSKLCACLASSLCVILLMLQYYFRLVKAIICFVCSLFAEQFRSGCHTTLSGSRLNSKQLLPSANPLVITQPLLVIFQLRWANTAGKLLLPQAKNVKIKPIMI